MTQSKQSWSIIILCYNEAGNIQSVLKNASEWLAKYAKQDSEIVLVNDGSTDGSETVIRHFLKSKSEFPIQYIEHPKNLGIGAGLKKGYQTACKENVVMIPGDGQFDINELTPHRTFLSNEFIAFYRPQNEAYSFFRRSLTAINRWVNRVFLRVEIQDVNWIKAYKKQSIQELTLYSESSLIETEICAKLLALNYTPIEVPSQYHSRASGTSKGASWKILKQAIFDLPRLSREVRAFKSRTSN